MKSVLFLSILFVFSQFSPAVAGPADERFIRMLTSGDMRELKMAAKEIKSREIKDPHVMDVVAEVLLQLHSEAWDAQIDSLSWAARALGGSRNGRYFSVLEEVNSGASNKKLRRHAKKALKELSKSAGKKVEQYKKGMRKVKIKGH
ncbi:MAG: hypothetical protein KTR17_00780 [Cellvibrionaceae bacterium]|nr:hypothetical protein [Cellvibrionaceae bacterium]